MQQYSPTKNNSNLKRPRKNIFSNTIVNQEDVGEFQGGYFIMPTSENTSLNSNVNTNTTPKKTPQKSPSRRKHNDSYNKNTTSPKKTPPSPPSAPSFANDFEKENTKGAPSFDLMTPSKSSSKGHITKHLSMQSLDVPSKVDSPSTSCRWAGPAFGNAPHPSSLPIPVFNIPSAPSHDQPPQHPNALHAHGRSLSVDSSLSYQHYHPSSYNQANAFHSLPPSPPTHPSLDQLSTDLRRMLNIGISA